MYDSLLEAVDAAEQAGISLGELALQTEAADGLRTRAQVEDGLRRALDVMRGAVATDATIPGSSCATTTIVGYDPVNSTGNPSIDVTMMRPAPRDEPVMTAVRPSRRTVMRVVFG